MGDPLFDEAGHVIDRDGLRSTARGLGQARATKVEPLAETRTQQIAERHHLPDGTTEVHINMPTAEVTSGE